MAKKGEPDGSGALTHNPFARLAQKRGAAENRAQVPGNVRVQSTPPALAAATARSVRMRLEPEGSSGKVVTRISGLPQHNLAAVAARLGAALGCRAAVQAPEVVLSGALEERAAAWLERAGNLALIRDEAARTRPVAQPALEPASVHASTPEPPATQRANIRRGLRVAVVLKADQDSGKLTEGVVREILTSSAVHPRGIKVRLESGDVGRVRIIRH